jgi:DNA repair exonuclease SbcCD nuclease subunit
MAAADFVRLLHISDLHFNGAPFPPRLDPKVATPAMRKAAGEPPDEAVRHMLLEYLKKVPEDQWPSAIVVSGDVVDRGGTDTVDGVNEFKRGREFLRDLAADLGIKNRKRVFVVPGNHDVTWQRQLARPMKFTAFADQMSLFTRPIFDGEDPLPAFSETLKIKDDIRIELTLLISPTFSGIEAPLVELETRVRETLKREAAEPVDGAPGPMVDDDIERTVAALREAQQLLDIALIGARQLNAVQERPQNEGVVRIAVMHHHLLPDPQIELAQFESVLDAGRTLQVLMDNQFDLVLHGHKHNARLATYRHARKSINIYAAPSLFVEPAPGFAFIDVFGPSDGNKIRVMQIDINYREARLRENAPEVLEREGNIIPELLPVAAAMPSEQQRKLALPSLSTISDILEWAPSYPGANLHDALWEQFLEDTAALQRRHFVFKKNVMDLWRELLEIAAKQNAELRMVSNEDLAFWLRAQEPETPAWEYRQPLVGYPGKKSRILLFHKPTLMTNGAKVEDVVKNMIADGFNVIIGRRSKMPERLQREAFGVIGDLAVVRVEMKNSTLHKLIIDFDPREVQRTTEDWRTMNDRREWKMQPNAAPDAFRKWLKNSYRVEL